MSGRICFLCEADDRMLHKCNHCGELVCPTHLLPENHDCFAFGGERRSLDTWATYQERFGGSGKTVKGSERTDFRPESNRHESGTAYLWECVECGAEYATHQTGCVCGNDVLKPIRVTSAQKEAKLPDSARKKRRERKRRRREEREKQTRATPVRESTEILESSIWEPPTKSIFHRIVSIVNGMNLMRFDSPFFVKMGTGIQLVEPKDEKFKITFFDHDDRPSGYRLEKVGVRVYGREEFKRRMPRRVTKIADCEWDKREDLLLPDG